MSIFCYGVTKNSTWEASTVSVWALSSEQQFAMDSCGHDFSMDISVDTILWAVYTQTKSEVLRVYLANQLVYLR